MRKIKNYKQQDISQLIFFHQINIFMNCFHNRLTIQMILELQILN
ncbi:hypothetical protein pb186bvf_013470 [Paramecium bursaria]